MMNAQKLKIIRGVLWGLLALTILSTAALFLLKETRSSQKPLPVYGFVPEFRFTESHGTSFGLEDLKGKISVVDFVFTSCRTACPVMSARMSQLYQAFSGNEAVQFVSISVDPEHDTLEVLRQYAQEHGATDQRWAFLRAPSEKVKWLAEKGFFVSGDFPMMHSTKFILVDRQGRIRGYYDSFDPQSLEQLKAQIQELLEQGT
ncbi:MAG: SCO family protein [Calditrichaeota bacterium]|nr:MAG: SCO family protein [Calditrichota bacterium]